MDIENALKEMIADDSAAIISVDFAKAVLKQIREYEGQLNTAENELIELRAKLAAMVGQEVTADKPARITEQDAREIFNSIWEDQEHNFDYWIENCGGRALLNKLNAERQVPAVSVPDVADEKMVEVGVETLRRGLRLFPDNLHQVISNVWEDMYESAPSHSQQRCNIGNAESHDKELQVTIEHNGKIFGVDESISEFVQLLNSVGLETVASCSGHGHRPANIALKDGREIIIARNYEEGREIDRIFPVDINGDRCPSNEREQQIPECFKKLTRHAVGMCFGTDWNNGTAATIHRENLINSAWECDKYLSENSHDSEQGGDS